LSPNFSYYCIKTKTLETKETQSHRVMFSSRVSGAGKPTALGQLFARTPLPCEWQYTVHARPTACRLTALLSPRQRLPRSFSLNKSSEAATNSDKKDNGPVPSPLEASLLVCAGGGRRRDGEGRGVTVGIVNDEMNATVKPAQ
jgi:hypothetical protein